MATSGRLPVITVYYQARILSAKPVREAFLQLNAIESEPWSPQRASEPATAAEELQNRLQELLASYPDDLLVKGDDRHMIIGVSQKIRTVGILGARSEQGDLSQR